MIRTVRFVVLAGAAGAALLSAACGGEATSAAAAPPPAPVAVQVAQVHSQPIDRFLRVTGSIAAGAAVRARVSRCPTACVAMLAPRAGI